MPGATQDLYFTTAGMVNPRAATQGGGSWLSVALDGTGSFRFEFPYRVRLNPDSELGQGTYAGSVTTTGGSSPADNQTIPVTMRVTSQPVARLVPDTVNARLAQGAPASSVGIAVQNDGMGDLSIQGATATGQGITAASAAGSVIVTLDPGTLAPGVYNGSVAIATNAANPSITVPVNFEVVAKGAPLIYFQGAVDNATFKPGDIVSQGDIVVVKGEQFSFNPLTVGKAAPLATEVGGAQVLVNGKPAPMYYSSYGQLAFQMPVDTPVGTALVQVQREGQNSNTVTVGIEQRAPRLLLIGSTSYGAIQNAADYSIPMPSGAIPGVLTHPAKNRRHVAHLCIGMGATSPAVATGDPAPGALPFATLTNTPWWSSAAASQASRRRLSSRDSRRASQVCTRSTCRYRKTCPRAPWTLRFHSAPPPAIPLRSCCNNIGAWGYRSVTRSAITEVIGELGRGGMGQVFRVRSLITDREEAMKVMAPGADDHPEAADRFLREIRVHASLRHPNIAALNTALRIQDRIVMIMELVEGVSRQGSCSAARSMPPPRPTTPARCWTPFRSRTRAA